MSTVEITPAELKHLCTLLMVNDPWPLSVDQATVVAFVDNAAKVHGYSGWVDAYHALWWKTNGVLG